jgi:hypothetical protein
MKKNSKASSSELPNKSEDQTAEGQANATDETPNQRRKRIREEERQRALAEQEAQERERLAGLPARLFQLQVEIAKLDASGVEVTAKVVVKDPTDRHAEDVPGLYVMIGRKNGRFLSLTAEEWEFSTVRSAIDEEVERMAEEARQRALAADVKSRLKPEELEALKKFG